jgi:hypothetical protein
MASSAALRWTWTVAGLGQTKRPRSSRLENRRSLGRPRQDLQKVAPLAPEHEQLSAERILRQLLLNDRGQAVEALAHIDRFGRQPRPSYPVEPRSWPASQGAYQSPQGMGRIAGADFQPRSVGQRDHGPIRRGPPRADLRRPGAVK